MAGARRYNIDMVNGPLASKILLFAMPLIAANLMNMLFNAADVAVVGKFVGDASQAAVTSSSPLVSLLVNLFQGLSVGVSIVVGRSLGGGDRTRIGIAVHTGMALGITVGLLAAGVGELASPLLLDLLNVPDSMKGLAVQYLRIYFLGVPGGVIYAFGSALLWANGDTKRPMYYVTISGVVNLALNLIFVIVFRWDVAGVAWATTVSKYLSAALVMRCLMQETGSMQFDPRRLCIDSGTAKEIVRIGVPAALQSTLFILSNVVVQSAVNSMGEIVMAGSGAAASIGGFIGNVSNAFNQTGQAFASQNRGAGKTERIDRGLRWNLLFALVFPSALGLAAYVSGPWLLRIYTNSAEVVGVGMIRLLWVCVPYGMYGIIQVFSGTMRALGRTVYPTVISLIGTCALRILWVATVFKTIGTPVSLFVAFPITWGITITVLAVSWFVIRPKEYARIRREMQVEA